MEQRHTVHVLGCENRLYLSLQLEPFELRIIKGEDCQSGVVMCTVAVEKSGPRDAGIGGNRAVKSEKGKRAAAFSWTCSGCSC